MLSVMMGTLGASDKFFIKAIARGDVKTALRFKKDIAQYMLDSILHFCGRRGNLEALRLVQKCGADKYDYTALLAAEMGHIDILEQLYSWGISDIVLNYILITGLENNLIDVVRFCYNKIKVKNLNNIIAVIGSTYPGSDEIVRFCVDNGADPDIALAAAARNRNLPLVKMLIEKLGATAIDWAVKEALKSEKCNTDSGMIDYLENKRVKLY